MTVTCGFMGCGHQVRRRGECGARSCPRNAGRRYLKDADAPFDDQHADADPLSDGGTGRLDAVTCMPPEEVREQWHGRVERTDAMQDKLQFHYTAIIPQAIGHVSRFCVGEPETYADAAAAVERLQTLPNPDDLRAVAPVILRSEAMASSRLEGISASHRRVAEASLGLASGSSADEIVRNLRILDLVQQHLSGPTFGVAQLQEANRELLAGTPNEWDGTPERAGVPRAKTMWVGRHYSPRSADFVAPPASEVPRLLDDLDAFLRRDDVPALVQAGIAHAQFLTIHPFVDGNGRTGRSLIQAVLRRHGVAVPVPISAAMLRNRDRYIAGLTAYQQHGDIDAWMTSFCASAAEGAEAGVELAADLAGLRARWAARADAPRAKSHPRKLVGVLLGRPVLTSAAAAAALGTDERQARRALERLEQMEILVRSSGRQTTWRAPAVLDLLDAFTPGDEAAE
jgi:Fic family protein